MIDSDGTQVGVIETHKALQMAQDQGLDLVEISPNTRPPVCKIIDWGKFQYQEAKRQQEARIKAKEKKVEIKGIRLRPNTDVGDMDFKMKQTEKFLNKGNKIKVEIVLRGREKAFRDQARQKLIDFIDKIKIPIKIEQSPKGQFNGFNAIIAPEK